MSKLNTTKHGLQVIGAGLPRTSTVSLQAALQFLGYNPTYHTITDFLPNGRKYGSMWLRAMKEEDKTLVFFVEDWVEMFPDAKVILELRTTPEAWLESLMGSIGKAFGHPLIYYLAYFVPQLGYGFAMNNLWDEQAKAKYGVGVRTTECYLRHQQYIKKVVPKDRLLEFKAGEGWGPLCEFLGKDVPEGEYPRKNDSKAANVLIKSFVVYGVGVWVGAALCGWGAVWGVKHLLDM